MSSTIMVEVERLIPLKNYTKPLLKLNPQEAANIREWNKLIKQYTARLSDLQDEFVLAGHSNAQKRTLKSEIEFIISSLNEAQKCIRSIRKSAYARQLGIDTVI